MTRATCLFVCTVLPTLLVRPVMAELVELSVVNPEGSLDPIDVGIDDGNGFVFTQRFDKDGDGRIDVQLDSDSGWALRIIQPAAAAGCDVWDFLGSGVQRESLPFEIPVFGSLIGASLGVELGRATPPDVEFLPGEIFTVTGGLLPSWPNADFVDTTGVPNLRTFVATIDTLPRFDGKVFVSYLRIEFRTPASCPEDLDGSGDVGFSDIVAVLAAWGPCGECPEDIDDSGDVDFGDVLAVLAAWGPCL